MIENCHRNSHWLTGVDRHWGWCWSPTRNFSRLPTLCQSYRAVGRAALRVRKHRYMTDERVYWFNESRLIFQPSIAKNNNCYLSINSLLFDEPSLTHVVFSFMNIKWFVFRYQWFIDSEFSPILSKDLVCRYDGRSSISLGTFCQRKRLLTN